MKRLSRERCKDAASVWVKLLSDDGIQSSSGELHWEGLQASGQLCARHRESYDLSKARRTCSVEGCEKTAQTVRGGVKLCKLHSSKKEKPLLLGQCLPSPGLEHPTSLVVRERSAVERTAPGPTHKMLPQRGTLTPCVALCLPRYLASTTRETRKGRVYP